MSVLVKPIAADISDITAALLLVKAKTDGLPADPADQSDLEDLLARKASVLRYWCHPGADKVTVTNGAADITFPNIVVAGLPAGLTLVAVRFALAIAHILNTSSSANFINAASKSLRVMISTGAWGANDIIGLTLDQNSLYTTGGGQRGGPVLLGPDIKATISADGTYLVQSRNTISADAIIAAQANLELYDVDVGLFFYFT